MQRVVWHFVASHKIERLFTSPVEQRIDLDQSSLGIKRRRTDPGAFGGLISAKASDPRRAAVERTRQRHDLADRTAIHARSNGVAQTIDALPCDQSFDAAVTRHKSNNAGAVAAFSRFPCIVGFRKKPSCVEGCDVYLKSLRKNRMCQRLIFKTETRRKDDTSCN